MLTDPKLRAQVDALWDKFWTGGLARFFVPQEEFAPYRGSSTGVVARRRTEPVEVVESLRGRMGESARQALGRACRDLEGLFESLLAESFS